METKVILSKDLCEMDAIRYVASRYGTTPEKILAHYLMQAGIVKQNDATADEEYELAPNELALFRDLGVQPSKIEIL